MASGHDNQTAARSNRERCGYRVETGLWAPLVCGREKAHTGTHIDIRPNVSIGFGMGKTASEASRG